MISSGSTEIWSLIFSFISLEQWLLSLLNGWISKETEQQPKQKLECQSCN